MQCGTHAGFGSWRRAVTRPGAGGTTGYPFDPLAAALLAKFALPELQDAASLNEWRNLASQLRKDPNATAIRITEVLDQLTRYELDRPVVRLAPTFEYSKPATTPNMRLVFLVTRLGEFF